MKTLLALTAIALTSCVTTTTETTYPDGRVEKVTIKQPADGSIASAVAISAIVADAASSK